MTEQLLDPFIQLRPVRHTYPASFDLPLLVNKETLGQKTHSPIRIGN